MRISKNQKGFALPVFMMLVIVTSIMVLSLSRRAMRSSHLTVQKVRNVQGKKVAEGGIQVGLVRLERRLEFLEDRILEEGMTEEKLMSYAKADDDSLSIGEPGMFWVDFMQELPGQPADESDFAVDPSSWVAHFTIDNSTHFITVRLKYANNDVSDTGAVEPSATGFNDVWLRYNYEIEAQDKSTGKIARVESYAQNRGDKDLTIQVHIARLLSQYNLFAEYNREPPVDPDDPDSGDPVYDNRVYNGPVYSKHTFYVWDDPGPIFNSSVQISTQALADIPHGSYWHINTGSAFEFVNDLGEKLEDNGLLNLDTRVLELPGHIEEDVQKVIAYYGIPGQPWPPVVVPLPNSVHHKIMSVDLNGGTRGDVSVSFYVNGDANIVLEKKPPRTTVFRIESPPGSGDWTVIEQDVGVIRDPYFLVYVDGQARVGGQVSERTKLTIAARDDVIITSSITYSGNLPSDDTVIGLVSWNGHVLISQDIQASENVLLYLHAVIMTPNGGFGIENWLDLKKDPDDPINPPVIYLNYRGKVFHTGAVIRKYALPTLNKFKASLGWGIETQYDRALKSRKAPPFFPGNGAYQLLDAHQARVVDIYRVF